MGCRKETCCMLVYHCENLPDLGRSIHGSLYCFPSAEHWIISLSCDVGSSASCDAVAPGLSAPVLHSSHRIGCRCGVVLLLLMIPAIQSIRGLLAIESYLLLRHSLWWLLTHVLCRLTWTVTFTLCVVDFDCFTHENSVNNVLVPDITVADYYQFFFVNRKSDKWKLIKFLVKTWWGLFKCFEKF